MQRVLIMAALLALAFYAYGEISGPGGGIKIGKSAGSSGGFSSATRSVASGVTGAASAIGN